MELQELKQHPDIISLKPQFEKANLPWDRMLDQAILSTIGGERGYITEPMVRAVRECLVGMLAKKWEDAEPKSKFMKIVKTVFLPLLKIFR